MLRNLSFHIPKGPSYYYTDKEEYYERLIFPRNIYSVIDVCKADNCHTSNNDIQFKNIPFGASKDEVIQFLGNPRFSTILTNPNFEILFFKEMIGVYKVITQVHFFKNEFFLSSYTFRSLNTCDVKRIKSVFLEKYHAGSLLETDLVMFSDKNENKIFFSNEIFTRICYLSGNSKIIEDIKSIPNIQQNCKKLEDNVNKEIFDNL